MHKYLASKSFTYFGLYFIVLIAFAVRTLGLNWDGSQHLHPDERFLTMVTNASSLPNSLGDYLDPTISKLNPYNIGFDFYVYGTLPLKITKMVSEFVTLDNFDYNNITLVGRFLSALFDCGILFLIFLTCRKIYNSKVGLIASSIYALTVLPIQLSHFYAVDTFLVFFVTLSFYFLSSYIYSYNDKYKLILSLAIGVALGLALACKISAVLFLPIIILGLIMSNFRTKNFYLLALATLFLLLTTYLSFRLANPESFQDTNIFNVNLSQQFISNLNTLKSFNTSDGYFPPGIQWMSTKPITFAFGNNILWGLGIPLGLISILTIFSYFKFWFIKPSKIFYQLKNLTNQEIVLTLTIIWILELFFYQSIQFSKNLRYFYPVYPFIAIVAANFLYQCFNSLKQKINTYFLYFFISLFFLSLIIWPVSFLSIYSQPHSRVTASEWIYKNIPEGSVLSCDLWDDCLPLSIGENNMLSYKIESLEVFAPDTPEKWAKLEMQLKNIDYLILTSNRAWGSIPKVPDKYPRMSKFYDDLFAGRLEFEKIAEFTSYPTFSIYNLAFSIPDDSSEESFTVYDHPKVMIFKKI